jgi:hypothetical protein
VVVVKPCARGGGMGGIAVGRLAVVRCGGWSTEGVVEHPRSPTALLLNRLPAYCLTAKLCSRVSVIMRHLAAPEDVASMYFTPALRRLDSGE